MCGGIYGGCTVKQSCAIQDVWEVKRMLREADSGLNDPRDMSNNLASGQPWSSELGTINQYGEILRIMGFVL